MAGVIRGCAYRVAMRLAVASRLAQAEFIRRATPAVRNARRRTLLKIKNNMVVVGDNLEIMRGMESGVIDLIYADPPFNTGKDWGAFNDKWEGGLKGYLKFMEARLIEMHRLLKETGSLYLHCDSNASHYLKVMMDGIFGMKHFRNEIVWKRRYGRSNGTHTKYSTEHDYILFYTKTEQYVFEMIYLPLDTEHIDNEYKHHDEDGRRYSMKRSGNIKTYGANNRTYLDEVKGISLDCIWTEGLQLSPFSDERVDYPTQKPLKLLDRIIKASSNQGDVVLDPFCGSGTTLVAAHRLGRKYIGIDQNPEAVRIAQSRLNPSQQELELM